MYVHERRRWAPRRGSVLGAPDFRRLCLLAAGMQRSSRGDGDGDGGGGGGAEARRREWCRAVLVAATESRLAVRYPFRWCCLGCRSQREAAAAEGAAAAAWCRRGPPAPAPTQPRAAPRYSDPFRCRCFHRRRVRIDQVVGLVIKFCSFGNALERGLVARPPARRRHSDRAGRLIVGRMPIRRRTA